MCANQWTEKVPLHIRFWEKVAVGAPDDCWLWTSAIDRYGYGTFCLNPQRRSTRAHRVAYELAVRPIPPGLELDHLCRTRACVNPNHLEPVTHAENMARGAWATRSTCSYGHALDSTNTYMRPGGVRSCRACVAAAQRRYRQRTQTV